VGERKLDRMINGTLEKSIGLKGVREDDEFSMDLFQERKRTFRLKRFSIILGRLLSLILIPRLDSLNFQFLKKKHLIMSWCL
jgi:hypothetical protein